MYSTNNILITILGVILSLFAIGLAIKYLMQAVSNISGERRGLIQLATFGFASLVGVFVIDKVLAFKINILTDAESLGIFGFIKELTLMIFAYFFGKSDNKEEK